ncbi:MAG: tellurite resistance TerB family protein [Verrucomicrobiota bacterium]|jgi:uncharacterized tellurite resistance protein B-like protein
MDIKKLSLEQQQAVLDLMVLAMYSDGHLTSAEDERVTRLLQSMGHASEYERTRQYDAAVTRIRQQVQKPEDAQTHAARLSQRFSSREQRVGVYQLLEEILASDEGVTPPENSFLSTVRDAFHL